MDCITPSNHKQSFLGNPERLPGSTIPTQFLEALEFSYDIHALVKRKPTFESLVSPGAQSGNWGSECMQGQGAFAQHRWCGVQAVIAHCLPSTSWQAM
jgi:hypothetical protein